jgi:hypothetical protein
VVLKYNASATREIGAIIYKEKKVDQVDLGTGLQKTVRRPRGGVRRGLVCLAWCERLLLVAVTDRSTSITTTTTTTTTIIITTAATTTITTTSTTHTCTRTHIQRQANIEHFEKRVHVAVHCACILSNSSIAMKS